MGKNQWYTYGFCFYPAPFFANLFLYYYESMDKTSSGKGFGNNFFRFIDDLNEINDAIIFESNFRNIYPEQLDLCRENGNNADATFLDLDIKIKNNKF